MPWAAHGISGGLPPFFLDALNARSAAQHRDRGLAQRARIAYVDPYPDLLHDAGEILANDRLPVRPVPFDRKDASYDPVTFDDASPRVLLTLGTSLGDGDLEVGLAESLAAQDLNVVVTSSASPEGRPHPRVRHIGFVPLARLLSDVDLVVSAGGTGTVLGALAAGLPLVVRPVMADQPLNAARAERVGAARTIDDAGDAGTAARAVLAEPGYRQAAEKVRSQIESLPGPADVLGRLLALARP